MMPGTVNGLAARRAHVNFPTFTQSDVVPVQDTEVLVPTEAVQVISPPETIEISSTEILRMTSTPWLLA